jgi:hypothetical protein
LVDNLSNVVPLGLVGFDAIASRLLARCMRQKPPKPWDEVDWEVASQHLIGAFPGATRAEVVARAEAAAITLDHMGSKKEAEAMRRAAQYIRKRMMH